MPDSSLELLLNFYVLETFVYASFQRYQPLEMVEVTSDIKLEKGSRKHTIWVNLKSKGDYALVLIALAINQSSKMIIFNVSNIR